MEKSSKVEVFNCAGFFFFIIGLMLFMNQFVPKEVDMIVPSIAPLWTLVASILISVTCFSLAIYYSRGQTLSGIKRRKRTFY